MLNTLGALLGGLGLFLLAVGMISNGLRLAAGRQLRSLLERYTGSPARGIASGALITALVQSSSAVTVATLGFVNAGILNLPQALGVVFGSNVGTTMTGWLVAAVGFKFKLELFALPLVGIGMFLRLTGSRSRRGALGEALAGFGLFFIGVDILRDGFAGLADSMTLPQLSVTDPVQLLGLVGIGFLMTVLTQSSSASVAMILTAASGDAVQLSGAAAMVIGANIGTTSTAALAVIGATANAKRVAAAHILFNLITGLIALLILPALLWGVDMASAGLGLEHAPVVTLALFHTSFNVLGVLLMWPLTGRLAVFLSARFVTLEETLGRPQHLDRTLLQSPGLADNALALEITRVATLARQMGAAALSTEVAVGRQMHVDVATVHRLATAIADFVIQLNRQPLSEDIAMQMPKALRTLRYFTTAAELADEIARAQPELAPLLETALAEQAHAFRAHSEDLLRGADVDADGFSGLICQARLDALEVEYQTLKEKLLAAGARFGIAIPVMNDYLEQFSRMRRLTQQMTKGVLQLDPLRRGAESTGGADRESSETRKAETGE